MSLNCENDLRGCEAHLPDDPWVVSRVSVITLVTQIAPPL